MACLQAKEGLEHQLAVLTKENADLTSNNEVRQAELKKALLRTVATECDMEVLQRQLAKDSKDSAVLQQSLHDALAAKETALKVCHDILDCALCFAVKKVLTWCLTFPQLANWRG